MLPKWTIKNFQVGKPHPSWKVHFSPCSEAHWNNALPQGPTKRPKAYLQRSGLLEVNLGPQSDICQGHFPGLFSTSDRSLQKESLRIAGQPTWSNSTSNTCSCSWAMWLTGSCCSSRVSSLSNWGGRADIQDIAPPETSRLHVMSNSKSSPRDLHLNTKTQLHSTIIKLQCWTPHAKQLARQEHNPTH